MCFGKITGNCIFSSKYPIVTQADGGVNFIPIAVPSKQSVVK